MEEHRARLVETIRLIAQWRSAKAREHHDDPVARSAGLRAANALRTLGNFLETLPANDPDLGALRDSRTARGGDHYRLSEEALEVLSRFGINRGAYSGRSQPDEIQMRKVLRRAAGAEQRARHAARQRAEAGYGDD